MAASLDNSGFWLPTHFLGENEKLKPMEKLEGDAGLCFPTEFPYEVDSPVSSAETYSSDDDDFLAGLSLRLARSSVRDSQRLGVPCVESEKPEKKAVSSGSPQSTLRGIGSWSGRSGVSSNGRPNGASQVSSPPATPFEFSNDTWELIYAAAGEVARLKMIGEAASLNHQQGRRIVGPPRSSSNNTSFYTHQSISSPLSQQIQFNQFVKQELAVKPPCPAVWGRQVKPNWPTQFHHQQQQQINTQIRVRNENIACGPCLDHRRHDTWPQLQNQNLQPQIEQNGPGSGSRSVFLCGSMAKRESTGTGVFLPRRYSNPSETGKKQVPVLVPAKVVQALNLNFNDMNGHAQFRTSGVVAPDHEALIARRNALLLHQRRMMRPSPAAPQGHFSHEANLPQEWTY